MTLSKEEKDIIKSIVRYYVSQKILFDISWVSEKFHNIVIFADVVTDEKMEEVENYVSDILQEEYNK